MKRALDFLEFELRLEAAAAPGKYRATVTRSATNTKPSVEVDLSAALGSRELRPAARAGDMSPPAWRGIGTEGSSVAQPRALGDQLFRAVFTGPILEAYLHSLGFTEGRPDTGLRLRLHLDPRQPELSALPWELLYRNDTRSFLARDPRTPLVRTLDVARPRTPLTLDSALKVLVVRACPCDASDLHHSAAEARAVASALQLLPGVEVHTLHNATLPALRQELATRPYHAVHFIGHGALDATARHGVLLLEDEAGRADAVPGPVLAEVIRGCRSLRLAFLSACHSAHLPSAAGGDAFAGVASALVLSGLPAVLAMGQAIPDRVAAVFARRFYELLAAAFPVDAATAEARLETYLADRASWDWAIPCLLMSAPHGELFRAASSPGASIRKPPRPQLTLPQDLKALSELDPAYKRQLLKRLDSRRSSPRGLQPDSALARGLLHLELGHYSRARDELASLLTAHPQPLYLRLYLAIAELGGRVPAQVSFEQIKSIEAHLGAQLELTPQAAGALLLLAAIRLEFYEERGLRRCGPTSADLVRSARRSPSCKDEAELLAQFLPTPSVVLRSDCTDSTSSRLDAQATSF